jgi:hypothetical protein
MLHFAVSRPGFDSNPVFMLTINYHRSKMLGRHPLHYSFYYCGVRTCLLSLLSYQYTLTPARCFSTVQA